MRSTDAGILDGGGQDGGVAQALEVWQYELTRTGQSDNYASQVALVGPPRFVIGEELFDRRVVGDVALHPRGLPPEAYGEVSSTADRTKADLATDRDRGGYRLNICRYRVGVVCTCARK